MPSSLSPRVNQSIVVRLTDTDGDTMYYPGTVKKSVDVPPNSWDYIVKLSQRLVAARTENMCTANPASKPKSGQKALEKITEDSGDRYFIRREILTVTGGRNEI